MIKLTSIENNWNNNNWEAENGVTLNTWKDTKSVQSSVFYDSSENICNDLFSELLNLKNDIATLRNSLLSNYFSALNKFRRLTKKEGINSTQDIIVKQLSIEIIEAIEIYGVPVGEYVEVAFNIYESILAEKRKLNIIELDSLFESKIEKLVSDIMSFYKIDIARFEKEISQLDCKSNTLVSIEKRNELIDLRQELHLIVDNLPEKDYIYIKLLLSWLDGSNEYVLAQFYEWETHTVWDGNVSREEKRQLPTLRATKFVKKGIVGTFFSKKPSVDVTNDVFSNSFFSLSKLVNGFGEPGLSSSQLKEVFSLDIENEGFFDEKYEV